MMIRMRIRRNSHTLKLGELGGLFMDISGHSRDVFRGFFICFLDASFLAVRAAFGRLK